MMCISPPEITITTEFGFKKQRVNCRRCWQCVAARRNDYAGRSYCEAAKSDFTWFITLTYENHPGCEYGRYDMAHELIHKEHFQKWIKRLRKAGLKIRYLAVAERGEIKKRVHFHAIIFGRGSEPKEYRNTPILKETRRKQLSWDYGHVWIEDVSPFGRSIEYVVKYLDKSKTDVWFTCSKQPYLGYEMIQEKAQQNIDAHVFPNALRYVPPNTYKNRYFPIKGAARRDFMQSIVDGLPDQDIHRESVNDPDRAWIITAWDALQREKSRERSKNIWKELTSDAREEIYSEQMSEYQRHQKFKHREFTEYGQTQKPFQTEYQEQAGFDD